MTKVEYVVNNNVYVSYQKAMLAAETENKTLTTRYTKVKEVSAINPERRKRKLEAIKK
jgi:hypothetical protein